MSYNHDAEVTLSTAAQVERDRLENIEELLHELDEWQRSLEDSLGDTKSLAGKGWIDRTADTLRRIAELDDELHVADFDPEWVAEFRGLLLDIVRATQTKEPLDAYDKLLLNTEAMRQLLRDALDGHVRGCDDNVGAMVEQLTQWLPRVSQAELAQLMGISTRQFQRWATSNAAPSRRAQLVARLIAILRRSWTPEGVVAWFYRPRLPLDGKAPIDVLSDARYEQELLLAVRQGRAQHGS
jgi:transcriptional regulator with XRE-family HTH domain